jgi:hypothetical protein
VIAQAARLSSTEQAQQRAKDLMRMQVTSKKAM